MGSGKADEVRDVAAAESADVILVDHALSPSQERNLEKLTGRRVLDRNGLILDIFAQRARSLEGKLEVELAQLKHIATRLVRGWTHLERQKGGIGMRGPGETQLETDRRLIGQRVTRADASGSRRSSSSARPVARRAPRSRCRRSRSSATRTPASPRCSAALTGADAYVADQLFATLDPTVRRITLPGGTAGRGRRHGRLHSRAAARAGGGVPVHSDGGARSDACCCTSSTRAIRAATSTSRRSNGVLAEIGAGELPQILVYNKIDRLDFAAAAIERDAEGRAVAVWISAAKRLGLDLLQQAIAERLARVARRARLRVPASAGALRSRLYCGGGGARRERP